MCDCIHCSTVPNVERYQRLRIPKNARRKQRRNPMIPYNSPQWEPPCGYSRWAYQMKDAVKAISSRKKMRRQRTPELAMGMGARPNAWNEPGVGAYALT